MSETLSPQALALCSENGLTVYTERSLSQGSTKIILAGTFAVAAAGAAIATYHGAWPAGLFMLAAPTALSVAFAANNKAARQYEILRFQSNDFEIKRVDKYGRLTAVITLPAWQTRFFSEGSVEDGLTIYAHGPDETGQRKTHPLAVFLSPGEKAELLEFLKEAQRFQSLPYHRQDEIRARAEAQEAAVIATTEHPPAPHA
ncbi:MAG: DUF2244 domain-containing protein [Alphaproteobacteria bacterium]|nr:DUF2244 domain-containing protein [Alphaproteobacteria bacterium]MCD8562862.1 DUF2244 domain-containing protein [Alphaproteobacteria bacterium]